jgi:hypothetical protein
MGFQKVNDLVYFLVDGQGAIHHMAFTWAATLSTMAGCRKGLAIPVKIVSTKTCANGATWLNAVLLGQSSSSLQKHQPNM